MKKDPKNNCVLALFSIYYQFSCEYTTIATLALHASGYLGSWKVGLVQPKFNIFRRDFYSKYSNNPCLMATSKLK